MDFDFTDDQEMLRDTVRTLGRQGLRLRAPARRSSRPAASRARPGRRLADLGSAALQVPEAQGGMGFGPVDAMVVMEELGRGLVLEPYAAVALVATSLLEGRPRAGRRRSWLQRIAEGKELVVLAHEERRSRYRLAHVETTAHEQPAAPGSSAARKIVVPGRRRSRRLHRPGARQRRRRRRRPASACSSSRAGEPGVEVRAYPTQDGASGADLVLKGAGGDRAAAAPATAFAALEHAVDIGIAALCAEAVGAMDKLVAITVEYMNTRKQFGVPIATLPGAAPPHRRRQDAARAGALDELLRDA